MSKLKAPKLKGRWKGQIDLGLENDAPPSDKCKGPTFHKFSRPFRAPQ